MQSESGFLTTPTPVPVGYLQECLGEYRDQTNHPEP
jgi:hypothetical protein